MLAPLYGAPALLAREISVRRGLGWPGLLLMVTALGVLEAVVIDQSVVNPDYRDFDGWADLWQPTYVPALDLSAYAAVGFVLGHTVASFGAPLALAAVISRDGERPWLGRSSMLVLGGLYLTAAGLVLADHVSSEGWQLSTQQLVGALVVVAMLGRRRPETAEVGGRRCAGMLGGPRRRCGWFLSGWSWSLPSVGRSSGRPSWWP